MHIRSTCIVVIGLYLASPATSRAEDKAPVPAPAPIAMAFVEAEGGWGVQNGELPYLPDGSPTQYKHPLTLGWSAGATAGWFVADDLAVIASYQYRTASTREGSLTGVLDKVQGRIHFHTVAVGVRLYHAMGPGRLRTEFAAGFLLPFETKLEYEYGPALAPAGIRGSGTMTDKFNLGYGMQAQIGYEYPVYDISYGRLYGALALEMRVFQSNNRGRATELENFIPDFAAMPPVAVTSSTENDNGLAPPRAYSVQDLTLRLAVGMRF